MTSPPPQGYHQIGDNRFRETLGCGYHDFVVGRIIEHRPGRTVTELDNVLMSALTGNTAPLHTDTHYSSTTSWGRPLVCTTVTLGIVAGMSVHSTSALTTGNLGLDGVRLEHPVFVGDTLYAHTETLARRRSASRPDSGLITCRTRGVNQDGTRVITFERTFLVPLDPEPVRAATHY
ncbi:MaoC family dehydratase [Streptomyces sp. MMBL 11-3]|uniref:MaoC family dehydratase n=1 Tax=Streptomyces sp. MMBL 11-3 TaxID=3382639 RepID=UPI0039B3F237